MSRRPQLAELETTLGQLVPTLARLSDLLVLQRQAVADGDLDRLLALTTDQELASARLATLETRRDGLQAALEDALGVQGLDAIAQVDHARVRRVRDCRSWSTRCGSRWCGCTRRTGGRPNCWPRRPSWRAARAPFWGG